MIAAADKKALKALCGKRPKAELTALFALVRRHDDRALLAVLAPPRKRKPAGKPNLLLADIQNALKPLLAPAAEKGDLLAEHLAKAHGRALAFAPRGLADAVSRLRAAGFSEKQIRTGAKMLMTQLAKTHDGRETVV